MPPDVKIAKSYPAASVGASSKKGSSKKGNLQTNLKAKEDKNKAGLDRSTRAQSTRSTSANVDYCPRKNTAGQEKAAVKGEKAEERLRMQVAMDTKHAHSDGEQGMRRYDPSLPHGGQFIYKLDRNPANRPKGADSREKAAEKKRKEEELRRMEQLIKSGMRCTLRGRAARLTSS